MIEKSIIGKRMKMLREDKGWSQKDTAKKIGKTQSTYAGWENEARTPPTEAMPMIAGTLETTLDYLYGLTDDSSGTIKEDDIRYYQEKAVFSLLGIEYKEVIELMSRAMRDEIVDFYKYKLKRELEKRNQNTDKQKEVH